VILSEQGRSLPLKHFFGYFTGIMNGKESFVFFRADFFFWDLTRIRILTIALMFFQNAKKTFTEFDDGRSHFGGDFISSVPLYRCQEGNTWSFSL
jgi:hypothetical protein